MRRPRGPKQQSGDRDAPRHARDTADASSASSLILHVSVSPNARARLLAFMSGAAHTFVLTSADGSMSIRVALDRAEARATPKFRYGKLTVDWSKGSISTPGGQAILSPTELRLLGALLEAGREVMTRAELSRRVWPDAVTDERGCAALPVYVHLLRRRLACIGAASALKTERGVGYRLEL